MKLVYALFKTMTQPRMRFLIVKSVALFSMTWAVCMYLVPVMRNYRIARSRTLLPSDHFIVPNIVHFIHYGSKQITYIEAICILAALNNQKPEQLLFHTDQHNFVGGKHWDFLKTHESAHVIEIKTLPRLNGLANESTRKMSHNNYAGEKLRILNTYGGIYVDSDNFIVRNLDQYRKYEMTVLVNGRKKIFDHMIIATKDARFLKEWLDIYKYQEKPWYYNKAAKKPEEILKRQPHIVHPMINWMGDTNDVIEQVYLQMSENWKDYYSIHLLIDQMYLIPKNLTRRATYPVVFNEKNIGRYKATIKEMVMSVYPRKDHVPTTD